MKIRQFDPEQDYTDAVSYWKQQKWPAIPIEMLPKTGIVVENEKQKLAFGWLYATDSAMSILEFIVGNPNADWKERDEAIHLVINALVASAESRGFKAIFTSANHERLMARYRSHGFVETDKNMTNFIRSIL